MGFARASFRDVGFFVLLHFPVAGHQVSCDEGTGRRHMSLFLKAHTRGRSENKFYGPQSLLNKTKPIENNLSQSPQTQPRRMACLWLACFSICWNAVATRQPELPGFLLTGSTPTTVDGKFLHDFRWQNPTGSGSIVFYQVMQDFHHQKAL